MEKKYLVEKIYGEGPYFNEIVKGPRHKAMELAKTQSYMSVVNVTEVGGNFIGRYDNGVLTKRGY